MNESEVQQIKEATSDYVQDIINELDPLFYHLYNFDDYIKEEIYKNFEEHIPYETFETAYDSFIEDVFRESNLTNRSYKKSEKYFETTLNQESQILFLKNVPQPSQKTAEWYIFRKQHLTGSNIWKLFSTDSCKRQLIYEKLVPEHLTHSYTSLSQGPLNWGHKYEPLTTMFYEHYNDVTVGEFGCVPHKSIPFIAASPDGIVTSAKKNGRMIEIKNVVSREITQTPKMEYYIQMQLQMEVCDLVDCDFVETKFVEYENEKEFEMDKYKIEKGMIMVFVKNNSTYVYEYSPLFETRESQMNTFIDQTFEKYNITDPQKEVGGLKWFTNVFWKLDIYSCVYVPRNERWFKAAYPTMEETWKLIEEEQNDPESYLKYKPKSRSKPNLLTNKEDLASSVDSKPTKKSEEVIVL